MKKLLLFSQTRIVSRSQTVLENVYGSSVFQNLMHGMFMRQLLPTPKKRYVWDGIAKINPHIDLLSVTTKPGNIDAILSAACGSSAEITYHRPGMVTLHYHT